MGIPPVPDSVGGEGGERRELGGEGRELRDGCGTAGGGGTSHRRAGVDISRYDDR